MFMEVDKLPEHHLKYKKVGNNFLKFKKMRTLSYNHFAYFTMLLIVASLYSCQDDTFLNENIDQSTQIRVLYKK